ncbi:MAG: MFS transporter [Chlamydiia bacterium]|nr:MFS transporter [Chlamydiia bacterium]
MSKIAYLRKIAPCLFAVLVDIMGFGLALPVLTSLFTTGDFLPGSTPEAVRYGYLAIGLILYPFFMFFGSSLMGDLSDIVGRRKILMYCMAGFFIGFFLMGLGVGVKSLSILFIGRSITGITAASLPTTMAAIADSSSRESKAANMSYVVFVQSIGFVLGPLLGGVLSNPNLVSFFSEAIPFYAAAIFALIAFIWITSAFHPKEVLSNKKMHPLRVILVFFDAAKHPRIRLLTTGFIFHQLGIGLFVQTILIYLQQAFNYKAFGMGLFNAYMGFWMGVGVAMVPFFSRRYQIEKMAAVSLALFGVSTLLISFSSMEWLIWFFMIFFGMFSTIAWSSMLTSFSHAVDEESQGWALGITGSVVALTFMISALSPNLIPSLGVMPIVGLGGVFILLGSFIVFRYCKRYELK